MSGYTASEYAALPEVLNSEQVARIFEVSPALINRWAKSGKIPGRQVGRQWKFSKTRLEEFLQQEQ
jgi:excisionase family DNA binding protein